jgi:glycosyltransferase involved in cell wall biosynthesis
MAARKAIVASAVGGIPYYIQDNDNGLLFESENIEDLAAKLSRLLLDSEIRKRLAERAHERVKSYFDERAYVRAFQKMLQELGVETMASLLSAQGH